MKAIASLPTFVRDLLESGLQIGHPQDLIDVILELNQRYSDSYVEYKQELGITTMIYLLHLGTTLH